ncbi:hypothetical protein F4810DRAFT_268765 [Camillea tinctor]|nr:hypothetical protein F4810DRAFT_268765 [Camillea tinctor]
MPFFSSLASSPSPSPCSLSYPPISIPTLLVPAAISSALLVAIAISVSIRKYSPPATLLTFEAEFLSDTEYDSEEWVRRDYESDSDSGPWEVRVLKRLPLCDQATPCEALLEARSIDEVLAIPHGLEDDKPSGLCDRCVALRRRKYLLKETMCRGRYNWQMSERENWREM